MHVFNAPETIIVNQIEFRSPPLYLLIVELIVWVKNYTFLESRVK